MSTGVPPEPTAPPANSNPPGAAPTGTPEFRYGEGPDVPAWARGKTAAEVLGITTQLYGTVEQITRGAPAAQPQAPQPPAAPQQAFDPDMPLTYGQVNQWG